MTTWALALIVLMPIIIVAILALVIYVSRMQPFDHNHYD